MNINSLSREPSKANAVRALCPTAEFSITDGVIKWDNMHGESQPTYAQVVTKWNELKADHAAKAYQRTRAAAYPEIGDQLDNLYKDLLAGKLDSTGEFAKAIKTIKDANPKP